MRVLPCMILTALLCLSATGCSLFNKKSGSGGAPVASLGDGGRAPARFPTGDPLMPGGTNSGGVIPAGPIPASHTAENALLAGRIVDAYNRAPSNTMLLRWVCLEEDQEDAAPIDVTVRPEDEGYFTIQGLRPGAQYKLVARTDKAERPLAGVTYTSAPNVRVVIQVREEFAAANNVPPARAEEKPVPNKWRDDPIDRAPKKAEQGKRPTTGAVWAPTPSIPSPVGRPEPESDLPARLSVPTPPQQKPTLPGANPSWVPNIAGEPNPNRPPLLNIGPQPQPQPKPAPTPPALPKQPTVPADPPKPPPLPPTEARLNPSRVPTCVLVVDQLEALALNDTAGHTWDFKTQRRGRLVLLDFWATHCAPCRMAIPTLMNLQSRYGPQGLEVIGIALEGNGTVAEQSRRVNEVTHRLNTNYRQLLGENHRTQIEQQFRIEAIPTLILLDETGKILWRHTGLPDEASLRRIIENQLSKQAF